MHKGICFSRFFAFLDDSNKHVRDTKPVNYKLAQNLVNIHPIVLNRKEKHAVKKLAEDNLIIAIKTAEQLVATFIQYTQASNLWFMELYTGICSPELRYGMVLQLQELVFIRNTNNGVGILSDLIHVSTWYFLYQY